MSKNHFNQTNYFAPRQMRGFNLKYKYYENINFKFVVLLTLSCNSENGFETQTIKPYLVGKGHLNYNTIYSKQNIVITNNNDWQTLLTNFNSINNNIASTFTETNVDFNNYQIIVVIEIKNISTSVDVTNIVENASEIVVTIQNLQIGLTQDVAQPFHIVKIPKSAKPVVFQ